MADRFRGENFKPVKNPLLSGAGAGFPFESFPGSSLLVPVAKESPPIQPEDEGEVDTFVGQEAPGSEGVRQFINPSQERPPSASQKYTGLFSSFFGSSQVDEELPVQTSSEAKTTETRSSVSSTPRSYSPFYHVPSVLSYSPALLVPEDKAAEEKTGNFITPSGVQNQPTLVPSRLPEVEPLHLTPTTVSQVPPSSQNITAQPPTLYFSNPASNTLDSFLPPPPVAKLDPAHGNLYRQAAKGPKTQSIQPPVSHFIPVFKPTPQESTPANELNHTLVTPVETASSSSSNDSIVADLQSRFGAADISAEARMIDTEVSLVRESSDTRNQGVYEKNQGSHSFFTSKFAESSSDPTFGNSQALFESAEHQHSIQSEDRDRFRDSFGVIGQPLQKPSPPQSFSTSSDSDKAPAYGVPFQGFGQLSSSSNLEKESPYKPSLSKSNKDEGFEKTAYVVGLQSGQQLSLDGSTPYPQTVEPGRSDRSPIQIEKDEGYEKTFYNTQEGLTSGSSAFSAALFYDQPNFSSQPILSQSSSPAPYRHESGKYGTLASPGSQKDITKVPFSHESTPVSVPASASDQTLSSDVSIPEPTKQESAKDTSFPIYPSYPPSLASENFKEAVPAPVYSTDSSPPSQELPFSVTSEAQALIPNVFSIAASTGDSHRSSSFATEDNTSAALQPAVVSQRKDVAPDAYFDQPPSTHQLNPESLQIFSPAVDQSSAVASSIAVAPPSVQGAPPTSIGNRNFRIANQRRPVYAPVPGLSSRAPQETAFGKPSIQSTPSPFFTPSPAPNPSTPFVPFTPSPVSSPPNPPGPSYPLPILPSQSFTGTTSLIQSPPVPLFQPASTSAGAPSSFFSPTAPSKDSSSVNPSPHYLFNNPSSFPIGNHPPPSTPDQPPTDISLTTYPPSQQSAPPNAAFFTPIPISSNYLANPNLGTTIDPFAAPPSAPPGPVTLFDPTPLQPTHSAPTATLFDPAPLSSGTMASPPSDPGTLNTVDLSTPSPLRRSPSPSVVPQRLLNLGQSGMIYRPPYHHWFWNNESDDKESWQPFSMNDSLELEQAFNSTSLTMDTTVATDGGRYDVSVAARRRESVYWRERPRDVRRCSWFYRCSTETRFRPYDENTAFLLEEEYKAAVNSATWNRRVQLNDDEYVMLYGPSSMAHFLAAVPVPDGWDASTDLANDKQPRPRIVKRGVDDFEIEEGESPVVDHLLFVVHGIGAICDLKFRSIEEAVNDFRSLSHQLVKTHYRTSVEKGEANRVEILPVSWHHNLHGDTGVDEKLKKITLKSIPKLRHFTNDTLLDILFYTSPVYCQNIMQQVGQELNQLYDLFLRRNPGFGGSVSVAGHSLGSLILFDMLCHQKRDKLKAEEDIKTLQTEEGESRNRERTITRTGSYVTGTAGTGQPFISYPQLNFQPNSFFAMGSPIGMFVTVRGIDSLGLEFRLPTCPGFFNIFHPFDPVAYRIEALINPELADKRPVLIPHHKGRKRMHLELRETMARVGADLKQKVIDSVKATWNTVYHLTMFGRGEDALNIEVDQAIASQMEARVRTESTSEEDGQAASGINAGVANQGRRIDFVLQEAPLESFNEYVSAITSHVCYWDSDDTMLFILKDIYNNMGVAADSPASIAATAEEEAAASGHLNPPTPPSPTSFVTPRPLGPMGMDPTEPMSSTTPAQPPPMTGFVRK